MKIAVTSQNRLKVTPHAGRCRRFWIFDIEDQTVLSKELLELEKDQVFHGYAHDKAHPIDDVDIFITGSLGLGLVHRLDKRGIKAIATEETDIDLAVQKFMEGTLIVIEPHSHHEHQHGQKDHGCNC